MPVSQLKFNVSEDSIGEVIEEISPTSLRSEEAQKKLFEIHSKEMLELQSKAVCLYLQHVRLADIAIQLNIPLSHIRLWKKQGWWKEAMQDHLEELQENLHLKMVAMADKILQGLESAVDPENTMDKTANAKVNAAKLLLSIGNNPILKQGAMSAVQVNVGQTSKVKLNQEKLKKLSQAQLIEIARSGVVPEEVVEKE